MTDRNRFTGVWPLAAAMAIPLASEAALGVAMVRTTARPLVYPLDDTYIQMAIAKTLAAHGTWGVTRYEFSDAGSSLLWPLLLAVLDRLAGLDARSRSSSTCCPPYW